MTLASPPVILGNRYILHDQIGVGNMGVVFRATDRLTGQNVALKRVTASVGQTPFGLDTDGTNARLALANEFQLLASLRHPHIISVLDYGFDDKRQPYYTMELLEGATPLLRAARDQSTLARVNLLAQTLQALTYLHRRGILHRDLKPANILVIRDRYENGHGTVGSVKVLDFGLSVLREKENESETAGTPSYMAPEVLRGRAATEQADLYALGVMAFEMFVGRHPFERPDSFNLIQNILNLEAEFPDQLDEPLALVIRRLLSKAPEDRYDSAEAVINALSGAIGEPLAIETPATRESFLQASAFVGREKEMEKLRTALNAALDNKGSAWLVGGESGVGKSRLLNELRTLALVKGALVLRGQAVNAGGASFEIWRSVMQWLSILTDVSAGEASVLKPIVPTIGKILGRRVSSAATLDPRGAQTRLISVISDLMKRLSAPTVILLEDVHWADEESLMLLARLIPVIGSLPVLIVASYRDDEAPDLIGRLPGMQHVWLDRLSEESISKLSVQILGAVGGQETVVEFLRRETEGNPFFLVEVIRALAETAGELNRIGSMELPEQVFAGGIQRVVTLRLARAPEWVRPLLEFAAVVGRVIDLTLMEVTAPEVDLDLWLAECANAAIIDVGDEHWRFAHDKLRDAVLADVSGERLRTLHEQAARAIQNVHPDEVAALAYHWRLASDAEQELHYVMLAGESALQTGSFGRALHFFERALEAESALLRGDMQPSGYLRRQLGETLYGLGDYERARTLLRDSVRYSQQSGNLRSVAYALNVLGNIALAMGDFDEARDLLRQSVEVSKSNDSRLELGRALRSLGVVTETTGDLAEAKRLYRSALTTLSEVDDTLGTAGALANLAGVAHYEGNNEEARRLYYSSLDLFEAIGFQWGLAWTLTSLGSVAEALGSNEEALRLHERAVSICRDIGHKWGTAYCLTSLGNLCLKLGLVIEMRAAVVEALRIALEIHTVPLALNIIMSFAHLMQVAFAHEYAAELVSFVLKHPAVEAETVTRAGTVVAELMLLLTPEQFSAAQARGETLSLDEVTNQILRSDDALAE